MFTQMTIRIAPELKERLVKLARLEGKSASEVVRDLVENYVRQRDIGPYIDDLWDRVGGKLREKSATLGITDKDITKAIREVRKQK